MFPIERAAELQMDTMLNRVLLLVTMTNGQEQDNAKYLRITEGNIKSITENYKLVSEDAVTRKEPLDATKMHVTTGASSV